MNALSVSPPSPSLPQAPARRPWYHWRRWGWNILTISIIGHLLFGAGAAYVVVQTIQRKQKQDFTAPSSAANAPTRALEHKVQMQKKQQTMSAPAQAKRITTTTNSKVALPTMPAMPRMDTVVTPVTMAGMGGTGVGLGQGTGNGTGTGPGGSGLSLFGVRTPGVGLAGTFYDLKQNATRGPTNMTPEIYGKVITDFMKGSFNVGVLNPYFKSNRPMFTTQIWIPIIPADLGPAAFGLAGIVQPRMWCVHYRGRVTAPGSFTFHFVGAGDDVMIVKFNGKIVLERCWYIRTGWKSQADYHYDFSKIPDGFAKGDAITVEAGKTYPMEVIIGEQPGGEGFATLLQEVDGVPYDKDKTGSPILPVFRMSDAAPAVGTIQRPYPPHRSDGPVWKAEPVVADTAPLPDSQQ